MPQFNDENIKKIASKMKEKKNSEVIQNIKKLAQDEDGREILSAVIDAVKESELEKEAVGGIIADIGRSVGRKEIPKAVQNLGKAVGDDGSSGIMSRAYDVLSNPETSEVMKNLGIGGAGAMGTLAGGAYLGQHAYDYTMGQGSKPGNKRLQEILDTIPELKEKYTTPEIQRAWDTLREHGPRLANSDPVTAGKILERLLDYEGVDIQAIEQIIDVERKKREERQDKVAPIRTKSGRTKSGSANEEYINSLPDKIEETDKNNEIDKEAANEEFNELKELVSEYDN